jgi:hypothetical protein
MFEQGKSRPPFARPAQDTTATVLKGFTRVRWHTFFFIPPLFYPATTAVAAGVAIEKKNCKLPHFRFFLYFLCHSFPNRRQ